MLQKTHLSNLGGNERGSGQDVWRGEAWAEVMEKNSRRLPGVEGASTKSRARKEHTPNPLPSQNKRKEPSHPFWLREERLRGTDMHGTVPGVKMQRKTWKDAGKGTVGKGSNSPSKPNPATCTLLPGRLHSPSGVCGPEAKPPFKDSNRSILPQTSSVPRGSVNRGITARPWAQYAQATPNAVRLVSEQALLAR